MTIEIKGPGFDGFQILMNGETVLECVPEEEVKALTIGELQQLLEMDL